MWPYSDLFTFWATIYSLQSPAFIPSIDMHPVLISRKMQVSGATDLASKGQGASNCSNSKFSEEMDEPFHSDTKVRCPCGTSLETESMIKVKRSFSSEFSSIISFRCAYSMDSLYGFFFSCNVSEAWS